MGKYITHSSKQTKTLGEMLAKEVKSGTIICLEGDLGSGKTTFVQGFLKGLKIEGPYTSPTFVIMKKYSLPRRKQDVYHIDAYRIKEKGLLELGWKEIAGNNPPARGNIVIVEWADRIKKIIPPHSLWIKFRWLSEKERELILQKK